MFDRLGSFLLETELLGFPFPAHGSSLYFKVAELNPESELLVVQGHSRTGFFPASAFKGSDGECRLNTREQKEAVQDIFAILTRDLQALARTYQID
ncbi:MAG: hypothetical protein M3Q07_00365 [Pseudobdellovibrionaceae bacterium]|nr:hypothetical protein [Pseudobdellovibrionaceae bacterium]